MNEHYKKIFQNRVVPKISVVGECWEVNLRDNGNGYRYVHVRPYRYAVHRLAYLAFNGEIPEELNVCHTCDNRGCANPKHLFIGTQQENMDDMAKKGRRKSPCFLGETNPSCKLTAEKVLEIRRSPEMNKDLAVKYGVSSVLIGKVKRREIWKQVG